MKIEYLFIALFLLTIGQIIGTHLQVKQYRKAMHRLHQLGNVGVGSKRRRFGPGNVVLIACDKDGLILAGEIMQGLTIFSGFTAIDDIVGKNIYDLRQEYLSMPSKRQKYYKGHLQALEALILRLKPEVLEGMDSKLNFTKEGI